MTKPLVSFDSFRAEWLAEIKAGNPSTTAKGNRFTHKLMTEWLDLPENGPELIYCDGAGDGGIDLAVLLKSEDSSDDTTSGDTWYLVQGKYGTAFAGEDTLIKEARKVFETLSGVRTRLSSLAEGLVERLRTFMKSASERDRLVLIFATVEPLTQAERDALDDVQTLGRKRLGAFFNVEAVSVETIFENLGDTPTEPAIGPIDLVAEFASSGEHLWVGTVRLRSIYSFLQGYRAKSGELDRIYEKNVRRYLGGRRKVNVEIRNTLEKQPEHFGLFNNGITIVAQKVDSAADKLGLTTPYIVNGCQTTRTLWDVLDRRLDAGGTGENPELKAWIKQLDHGCVVVKVVQVNEANGTLLTEITRFTNSQNSVTEKDFLALTGDFKTWSREMAEKHCIFLEIQRGGWDSQKAYQKQHPETPQFKSEASAFGLMKVYGAGWLEEPGTAWGKNPPFLPGGTIYNAIVNRTDGSERAFGVEDFYAAYLLDTEADRLKFGRGAQTPTRGSSRYLFCFVVISLLKGVMSAEGMATTHEHITNAVIKILSAKDRGAAEALCDDAANLIDEYLTQGQPDSTNTVEKEPGFGGDLNQFLKSDKLAKPTGSSPKLLTLIAEFRRTMSRASNGQPSPRSIIKSIITAE
ncbi:MAG: AIPR family protein [Opitutus sp.]|nr:AIPR family protein [Opitutus sp.]MCS6246040.1 AIPR family protein [Opitutus sp.]MCS6273923.1 AIPR family protein [Opitutus sp.]MCS6276233.1 AIPR family protein [Opitutus sp.]MCS6301327.1 AIPR family protein [Opitutus sp.]